MTQETPRPQSPEQLEAQIGDRLGLAPERLRFQYAEEEGRVTLNLVTIGHFHQQAFLLHSVTAVSREEALEKMLDYLRRYREDESVYTIQWATRESDELQTSYFRGKHIYDVLDKFYYGRDMHKLVVYSIILSPIT